MRNQSFASRLYAAVATGFVFAPLLVIALVSFSPGSFSLFPPQGVSLRWYTEVLGDPQWSAAFARSAGLAFAVAACTIAICLAAAMAVADRKGHATLAFELAVLAPLLLPHAAVAMVFFTLLHGAQLRGTFLGLAFAHVVLAIPFVYRPLVNSLRFRDRSLEEAAMSLGAAPLVVFCRVILPGLRKPLLAAFLFSWMLSFDEVTVSAFLVSLDTVTLPVAILQASQDDAAPLLAAISSLLIGLTIGLMLVVQRFVGLASFSKRSA